MKEKWMKRTEVLCSAYNNYSQFYTVSKQHTTKHSSELLQNTN